MDPISSAFYLLKDIQTNVEDVQLISRNQLDALTDSIKELLDGIRQHDSSGNVQSEDQIVPSFKRLHASVV